MRAQLSQRVFRLRDNCVGLFIFSEHSSPPNTTSVAQFGLGAHVSSTGQQFPADSRNFAASFARIRKGIANSCPIVNITYSNTQPFFLRTLISPHGSSNGGCMKRNRNMLAKYRPSSLVPSVRTRL